MIPKRQTRLESQRQTGWEIHVDEQAFRNNKYTVMINDMVDTTHGPAIRVMVQKHDDTPFINHWYEMQRIKNEIFGKGTMAIEYYPAESELIDHHNIYWMWIFPDNVIPMAL